MIFFFIRHKVHRVPGGKFCCSREDTGQGDLDIDSKSPAYTTYAFFEWSLVLLDVAFDAVTALDFDSLEVVVRDVKGVSKGYVQWLPK